MNVVAIWCVAALGILLFGMGWPISGLRRQENRYFGFDADPSNLLYKSIRAHANTSYEKTRLSQDVTNPQHFGGYWLSDAAATLAPLLSRLTTEASHGGEQISHPVDGGADHCHHRLVGFV